MNNFRQISKNQLLQWGIDIIKDEHEECGYLVTRWGTKNGRGKEYLHPLKVYKGSKKALKTNTEKVYYRFGFSYKGKEQTVLLHRAVYAWYKGECPVDRDIDHKDGNSLNNDIDNLRPVSRLENNGAKDGSKNVNQFGKRKREQKIPGLPNYIYDRVDKGKATEEEWDRYWKAYNNYFNKEN